MKWLLFFILLIPAVSASATSNYYSPGTSQLIYGACMDSNNNFIATNATIAIYDPSANLIINENMTIFSTGQFYYNITVPNQTGIYAYNVFCNSGGSGQSTFEVININEEVNKIMFLSLFLLICVALLFIVIAYKYDAPIYFWASAAWLLGFSIIMAEQMFGGLFSFGMTFVLIWALYLVFVGFEKFKE